MNPNLVRIGKIQLKGFKNISQGTVKLPSVVKENYFSRKADILGVYGQNGSGKTSIIEAMELIQLLFLGKPLPNKAYESISKKENQCSIEVTFYLEIEGVKRQVTYCLVLQKNGKQTYEMTKETLYETRLSTKETKELLQVEYSNIRPLFTPLKVLEGLIEQYKDYEIDLAVGKRIAKQEGSSFIFGTEMRRILEEGVEEYSKLVNTLHQYARFQLFVISNAHSESISSNQLLPFAFRLDCRGLIAKGDLPVDINGPCLLSKEHFVMLETIISQMNQIIGGIIPGLSIAVYDLGQELLPNGNLGNKVQLLSKRGDITIPLKYESEGIIKIISILNVLLYVFSDPSMCLIIDELDAGIYEYLLGELLLVFHKSGKGQLIFTSHNLRPLEMLPEASILFSTTNPMNRYIRMEALQPTDNLRDFYLRSITLGGQLEKIYEETDSVAIGRAFRRARKGIQNGSKN